MYEVEKKLLPEFPTTRHVPIEPNAARDDVVASNDDLMALLSSNTVWIEEKIDGANCGITFHNDQPVVRNRTHILNKAYSKTDSPAKKQFTSVWTWVYANKAKFNALQTALGFMPSVYGEWLFAQHVIGYTQLPDVFVAYDLFNPKDGKFIDTGKSRNLLQSVGFSVVPFIAAGEFEPAMLTALRDGPSAYSPDAQREGIYLKGCDGEFLNYRLKMVRPDFHTDEQWVKKDLIKNKVVKRTK